MTSANRRNRLLDLFDRTVRRALEQLRPAPGTSLLESRGVGRAQLPSSVPGLLVHAAEHTQRHAGQLASTRRVLLGIGAL